LEKKHLDKALQMLEEAHRLAPENPDILDSLGWAYFLKGNIQKAGQYIKKALEKKPDEPVILYHYGVILLKENKPCEAKKFLEKSLEKLLNLPIEPEKGILKGIKNTLLRAKENCPQ
jgi:predicted Zn-dependent protease